MVILDNALATDISSRSDTCAAEHLVPAIGGLDGGVFAGALPRIALTQRAIIVSEVC